MYEKFFKFQKKPFELLPNPEFLYPSATHKRAVTFLEYGIRDGTGFILLTGEIGSGKTTLIRNLLKKKPATVVLSMVFNTNVEAEQLIALINEDFGISSQGKQKITLLRDLNDFLIKEYAAGKQAVIVIDEAQNLSPESLEEIRLISNLETDSSKLVQIILVGQPELKKVLSKPELLQLRQRIGINCHLKPLSLPETEQYILYRLERAGNRDALTFSPQALPLIHKNSRGIPRLINIICDYLLLNAFASQATHIETDNVNEIVADLDFENQYWESEIQNRPPQQNTLKIPDMSSLETCMGMIDQRLTALELSSMKFDPGLLLDAVNSVGEQQHSLGSRLDTSEAKLEFIVQKLEYLDQSTPQAAVKNVDVETVESDDIIHLDVVVEDTPETPDESDGQGPLLENKAPKGLFRRIFDTLNE